MSDTNSKAGQQAIDTIAAFPAKINNAAKVVAGTSLGPWGIDVHCTYDSGCKKEHYSYTVKFSAQSLVNSMVAEENHAKSFFTAFAPVMKWLKFTLPGFSDTFDTASKAIVKIINSVKPGQGLTPKQKQDIKKQLDLMLLGLSTGKGQLGKGNIAMASFVKEQNTLKNNVGAVKNSLESSIQADLQKMIEWADGQHCGQGDAQSQFNYIETLYKASVNTFDTQFNTLSTDTQNASAAVGTLIGIVTDFIEQINKITEDLEKVEAGGMSLFMQKMEVLTATELWSNLSKDAIAKFGANEVGLIEAVKTLESAGVKVLSDLFKSIF